MYSKSDDVSREEKVIPPSSNSVVKEKLIIKDRIIYLIAPTYNYLIPGQMHWIGMHIPRIVHTILAQAYNTGNKLY